MGCCAPRTNTEPKEIGAPALASIGRLLDWRRDMAEIAGGAWRIGYEGSAAYPDDGEGPVRTIIGKRFLIDRAAVTNADFAEFVEATGYVTDAERVGASFVFYAQVHPAAAHLADTAGFGVPEWWMSVRGAAWSSPDGPGSDLGGRWDHPVVHVSWRDARTYARWAGKRLATEAEWEIAARDGLTDAIYPWGDEFPVDHHPCNIWQGRFPDENTAADGFLSTAPARSYAPNGFGLFNMVGNVWEWCADDWRPATGLKAMRGGSYLCHGSYCNRYRVTGRTGNAPDAASSHLGFRCVADIEE